MNEETRGYRDLIVWQKAMDLVPEAYRLAKRLPREELYELSSQIRRAAVSIPANIAEGQGRNHPAEFAQHLSIARGSLAELDTLLLVAQRLGYLNQDDLDSVSKRLIEVRKLLQGLLATVRNQTKA